MKGQGERMSEMAASRQSWQERWLPNNEWVLLVLLAVEVIVFGVVSENFLTLGSGLEVIRLAVTGGLLASVEKTPAADVKTEPAKVEPVPGKTAFYEIYKPARTWATDLMPLSMVSKEIPEFKNEGGKAAVWTAVFVSPSLRQARIFTYSIAESGSILKGVTAAAPQAWGGASKSAMPFQANDYAVDSDAAYKTAADKAADWLKANPNKKVTMELGYATQFPSPVWKVLWGDAKSGYVVYVNAVTGAPVAK
jgi:hypothetical protein